MTVVLILALFILHLLSPNFTSSIISTVGRPFFSARNLLFESLSFSSKFLSSKEELIRQNEELQNKIRVLELESISLTAQGLESEKLSNLLALSNSQNTILARVIAKPPQSPYGVLVLDGGESDGITVGARVYNQGILIGRITELSGHFSRARLFSHPGEVTDAESLRNGLSFSLNGKGGGNFEASIPSGVDIVEGDLFVIPGTPSSVIASVEAIEFKEADSFKKLFLAVPLNIYTLQWVEIEKQ